MSTTAKLSPEDIAETAEVAREYLQGGYGRADAEQLAGDFAKVIVQVASACVIGLPCDRHTGEVHGQEAEELRAGVEQILRNTADVRAEDEDAVLSSVRKSLVFLLDRVDARDSLSFREAVDAVIGTEGVVGDRDLAETVRDTEGSRDTQRLNWLAADPARLLQVRLLMLIEPISLHEAIDNSEATHKKLTPEA